MTTTDKIIPDKQKILERFKKRGLVKEAELLEMLPDKSWAVLEKILRSPVEH